MPAGHQQGDERKLRRTLLEHRRQQVPFHMVHADRRHAPGQRQGLGAGGADQQRADQPRPGGIGHRVDIGETAAGFLQHLANQRQHALDVVARGQLGHHAAIDPVQVDLTEQGVGQQAALAVVQGDAGFVAGSFQAQYSHWEVAPPCRDRSLNRA
ncbi:hypothetical protein D3C78_1164120 [compost metagenome]